MSKIAMRRRKGGFTLIEIMIVVLIIGILLAIAIPNFVKARETSRAKACISNLKQIETAKEQWAMDTRAAVGAGPADLAALCGADNYIKVAPTCPSSGTYTVGTTAADGQASCSKAADGHTLAAAGG